MTTSEKKLSMKVKITKAAKNFLFVMVGLNKSNRVFSTSKGADKFIRELRDQ